MDKERIESIHSTSGLSLPNTNLLQIARLDNKIFCGPEWGKGDFCDECGAMKFTQRHVPDPEAQVCENCGDLQISVGIRANKIKRELRKEASCIAVATNQDQEIVGYGWGFVYDSPETFVNQKYKADHTRQIVKEAIERFGINDKFYYFSGMGIDFNYRGQGLSHLLGKKVDDYAKELNLPGISRTLFDSPIVTMRKRLGFQVIVGPEIYPLADLENPKRVLMARHYE